MLASRRKFLKTGLIGGAVLATAFALRQPIERFGKQKLVSSFPLPEALREVIMAVAPVLLAGVSPSVVPDRAVQSVALAVSKLSAAAQQEIAELFALLTLKPTRIALAGVHSPWNQAEEKDIRAFLDRWRNSSLDLLKSGYQALHDLVLGSWYADATNWAAIGYPGPQEIPR